MTLAEYRDIVEERSDETGKEDRLACRNRAAAKLLEEMSAEQREKLEKERDDLHEESAGAWTNFQMMKDGDYDVSEETQAKYVHLSLVHELYRQIFVRCRDGLTRLLQPILDLLRKLTGVNFFLVAGLEYDNPNGGVDNITTMYVVDLCCRYTVLTLC
jgi:uncharacterized Zn finger protein